MPKTPTHFKRGPRRGGKSSGAWIYTAALTLLAVGIFAAGFLDLPPVSGGESPLVSHVAERYRHRSLMETGQPFPVVAVFSDYRALDLAVISLLWMAAAFPLAWRDRAAGNRKKKRWDSRRILIFLAPALVWGLGFECLVRGGNFFDYASLNFFVAPGHV
ncbi:MAG: hypothetical protein ACREL1_05845, partial [bacterium]